jgi:hypothetical protein
MDLSRFWETAKGIWAKPKAREGRASGRERVSPEARLLAFELIPEAALSRRIPSVVNSDFYCT